MNRTMPRGSTWICNHSPVSRFKPTSQEYFLKHDTTLLQHWVAFACSSIHAWTFHFHDIGTANQEFDPSPEHLYRPVFIGNFLFLDFGFQCVAQSPRRLLLKGASKVDCTPSLDKCLPPCCVCELLLRSCAHLSLKTDFLWGWQRVFAERWLKPVALGEY